MNWQDLLQETYAAITVNKIRSGLTILGIVIGISSVIGMVALGQGAQNSIEERIQSIGSNLLTVRPGAQGGPGAGVSSGRGSATTLTSEDADAIKVQVAGIEAIAPEVSGRYQVVARGTNTNTSVLGTSASYTFVRNIDIELGSFLSDQNLRSYSKVAVLGSVTRDDLFGQGSNPVGQKVRINNVNYTIIGVTLEKGGSSFGSSDDVIYVPLTTSQRFMTGNTQVSNINISVQNGVDMEQVEADVTNVLLIEHGIRDPELADFRIFNQADIVETASSITQTFTILLGAVAGISLIVGGIGIMNMMFTSVTERTREIGLRKAIGAKRRDINIQFLLEAVVLTLIGGLIGIALGWFIAYAATNFFGIAAEVSISSILLAFGVSAAIGIIFGYYPARKASKLNPIDALRYE